MKLLTLPAMIVLLLAVSGTSRCQSLLLPTDPDYLGFELLIPSFDQSANTSSGTVAGFVSLRRRVQGGMTVLLQLPLARSRSDDAPTEIANGNIYAGVKARNPSKSTSIEFGVWLPTARGGSESALGVGVLSDVDRWEAFFEETVSARFRVGYHDRQPNGNGLRFRVGPSAVIPTERGSDPEIFLVYSAHFTRQNAGIDLLGGISGRMWVTISNANLGQRTFHQLDLALTFKAGQVRLGAYVLVPLGDSLVDVIESVVGLQLGFVL